jgi:uncharacterized protein (DUF305 family)
MNKNAVVTLVIGLIIGIGGTVGVTALVGNDKSNNNTSSQSQTPTTSNTSMTMADMNKELATKTGSDFDKTFIEMMIQHHQGAIEMAKLSETRTDRQEIKTLSQNIIAAQEKEIADMKQWQMDWGFVQSGGSMPGMNH